MSKAVARALKEEESLRCIGEGETRIEVEGVELIITQVGHSVSVRKVVGRDRKRKIDITSGSSFSLADLSAIGLMGQLKHIAALTTVRCTCDYHYGYSDHAESCQSIYVARYEGYTDDD